MIVECSKSQEQEIFDYIGNEYQRCLYLYMDLKKYEIGSQAISVYLIHSGQTIQAVLLKYYTCLHVFSQNLDFNLREFYEFYSHRDFTMIYCEKRTAEYIWKAFPESEKSISTITCGWVAEIKKTDREPSLLARKAINADFNQIVKLIHDDEDIGRSYNFDDLAKQLSERAVEGYTRNYVLKDGDLVIAHACTNAEISGIAVVAELVVHKDYRRMGYASDIWRFICLELLREGNEVYSFYYSDESRALHKKIGFYEVCEWAKIVKDRS